MKMLVPPGFTLAAVATTRAGTFLPPPPEAEGPLASVRHVMAVYARHYAGRARASRDPDLLDELLGRLEEQRGRLVALQGSRPVALAIPLQDLSGHLALLGFERQQLRDATVGQTLDVRGSWLATRVNEAVSLYRVHFEMRPRLSRRPGLAWRVVRTFERLAGELAEIPGDDARANEEFVSALLAHARQEADHIAAAVGAASREERVVALGAAAQEEIELYRTQLAPFPRSAWDRALLGASCDRLGELAYQLDGLGESGATASVAPVVHAHLDTCERAWAELGSAPGEG